MTKKKGGNNLDFGSLQQYTNISDLNYKKQYTEFPYDNFNHLMYESNFVGGGKKKGIKINMYLKNMYIIYLTGKPSPIKKNNRKKGGEYDLYEQNMNLSYKNISNIKNLEIKPYELSPVQKLQTYPFSNFAYT